MKIALGIIIIVLSIFAAYWWGAFCANHRINMFLAVAGGAPIGGLFFSVGMNLISSVSNQ
jgi:hypothetical protein